MTIPRSRHCPLIAILVILNAGLFSLRDPGDVDLFRARSSEPEQALREAESSAAEVVQALVGATLERRPLLPEVYSENSVRSSEDDSGQDQFAVGLQEFQALFRAGRLDEAIATLHHSNDLRLSSARVFKAHRSKILSEHGEPKRSGGAPFLLINGELFEVGEYVDQNAFSSTR